MNNSIAFEIEKTRQSLAKKNKLSKLKGLYKPFLPEINNLNTSKFWNNRIDEEINYLPCDGMTAERIKIAYNFMPKNVTKVLDIGAGYGYIERKLSKKKNIEIFGNDISENAIKNLRKRYKGNFKLESLYKMKYKPATFDVVFMLEVLEHVPPSKTFNLLADVKKLLKIGGYLIVSVPTNEGLEDMDGNPNGHVRLYTEDLIKAELKIAGFKVLKLKTLYAFRNLYEVKKIISKIVRNRWEPNDIIILAQTG